MLKDMKIKTKLIVTFILIALIASISGIFSVCYLGNVSKEYSFAIKYYGFAQGDIGKLISCFDSINLNVHDIISFIDKDAKNNALNNFNKQVQEIDTYFNNVEASIVQQQTRDIFNQMKDDWNVYLPLAKDIIQGGQTTDKEKAQQLQNRIIKELQPLYSTIYNSFIDMMESKVTNGNKLEMSLSTEMNLTRIFVTVIIISALLLSFYFGIKISYSIAVPIQNCAKRLTDLAHGDLQSPIPQYTGENAIGILARATNDIAAGLTAII